MVWDRIKKTQIIEPFCLNYQVYLDNPDSEIDYISWPDKILKIVN
jgi:hypothetical protein